MKIVMMFPIADLTGGSKMGFLLAKGFLELGHNVLCFCGPKPDHGPWVADLLRNNGCEVLVEQKMFRTSSVATVVRVARKLKESNADLVFSIYQTDIRILQFLRLIFDGPIFIYEQNKKSFGGAAKFRGGKGYIHDLLSEAVSDGILCVSPKLAERQRKLARTRTAWVSSSIDVDEYKRQTSQSRIPENRFEVFNIGRLDEQKGQLVLLDAVERLGSIGDDVVLNLIGEVSQSSKESIEYREEMLRKIASSRRLSRCVRLRGWIDNPGKSLWPGCIYAHSANWEGWPLSVVEAMVSECLVIFSDCSGVPSDYPQELRKFVFKTGNSSDLAGCLELALAMPVAVRKNLGKIAHDYAERKFNYKESCCRAVSIFVEALALDIVI